MPQVYFLAPIEVEILFVPGFGTKRLERKAGKWFLKTKIIFAPEK